MIAFVAAVALAAAPGPGAGTQLRLAAPALQTVGMDPKLGGVFTEKLSQHLSAYGAQVVTDREIATVLGAERQKELLGCSDASCVTEIANALGVDALLVGDVAHVGKVVQLNLKLVSSTDAKAAAAWQSQVDSEDDVLAELQRAAPVLVHDAATALGKTLKPNEVALARIDAAERAHTFRSLAWIPAGAAVIALAGGGVALGVAANDYGQLNAPTKHLSTAEAASIRDSGKTLQTLGWVGIGAGVAFAAGSGALFWMGRDDGASLGVAFVPAPSGGAFASVQGTF